MHQNNDKKLKWGRGYFIQMNGTLTFYNQEEETEEKKKIRRLSSLSYTYRRLP